MSLRKFIFKSVLHVKVAYKAFPKLQQNCSLLALPAPLYFISSQAAVQGTVGRHGSGATTGKRL